MHYFTITKAFKRCFNPVFKEKKAAPTSFTPGYSPLFSKTICSRASSSTDKLPVLQSMRIVPGLWPIKPIRKAPKAPLSSSLSFQALSKSYILLCSFLPPVYLYNNARLFICVSAEVRMTCTFKFFAAVGKAYCVLSRLLLIQTTPPSVLTRYFVPDNDSPTALSS